MVKPDADTNAYLQTQQGTTPAFYVYIDWPISGLGYVFADTDFGTIYGRSKPRLLSLSPVSTVMNPSDAVGSTSCSVTIADTSTSTYKILMDTSPLANVGAKVCVRFPELGEEYTLFSGKIDTPVTWTEASNTISFNIVDRIESQIMGFVPHDTTDCPNLHPSAEGVCWPMPFGTVIDVPAVLIRRPPIARTSSVVDWQDYYIPLSVDPDDPIPTSLNHSFADWIVGGEVIRAAYDPDNERLYVVLPDSQRNVAKYAGSCIGRDLADADLQNRNVLWIATPSGGLPMPDMVGLHIKLSSGANSQWGVVQAQRGDKLWLSRPIAGFIDGTWAYTAHGYSTTTTLYTDEVTGATGSITTGWQIPRGAEAKLWLDAAWDYQYVAADNICNCDVRGVKAFRSLTSDTTKGTPDRSLVTIPEEYYTVETELGIGSTSAGATLIKFPTPLSSHGAGWEDELYVSINASSSDSVTSGGWVQSPLAQIYRIMDKFTDVEIGSGLVAALFGLGSCSTAFALREQSDAWSIIKDLSFQSGYVLSRLFDAVGTDFYPRPLWDSGDPHGTITTLFNDLCILENTLEVHHLETEDVTTHFIFNYSETYAEGRAEAYEVETDPDRYGVNKKEFNFWAYQDKDNLQEMANWLANRLGYGWKKLSFKSTLSNILMDTSDDVIIDLPGFFSPGYTDRARMVQKDIDTDDYSMHVKLWLPIRDYQGIYDESLAFPPAPGSSYDPFETVTAFEDIFSGQIPIPGTSYAAPTRGAEAAVVTELLDVPNGVVKAVLYPHGYAGTPEEIAVPVYDITADASPTEIEVGDRIMVTESAEGGFYTQRQGGGSTDLTDIEDQIAALQTTVDALEFKPTAYIGRILNHISGRTYNVRVYDYYTTTGLPSYNDRQAHCLQIHPDDEGNLPIDMMVDVLTSYNTIGGYWEFFFNVPREI